MVPNLSHKLSLFNLSVFELPDAPQDPSSMTVTFNQTSNARSEQVQEPGASIERLRESADYPPSELDGLGRPKSPGRMRY